MIRVLFAGAWLMTIAAAGASPAPPNPDKVASARDFGDIRREVETLRGKKFLRPVPVYKISRKELLAISDRGLDEDFPGPKLHAYEELLAWLDMIPAKTDLKATYGEMMVEEVAGLYDSEAKEMCIPSFPIGTTNVAKKAIEKKLEKVAAEMEDIVLAHEFTHALEDQYWPIDDPEDRNFNLSTDRGTAHEFVVEGTATREMIEVIPAQWGGDAAGSYFFLWNLIHSGLGEWTLDLGLGGAWKSSDALVPGQPDTLARSEAMPYSYGYAFCTGIMRQWGLDGLDYIYNHPPVSSAQVMHPEKSWVWRDLPAQIVLPETLPGGWTKLSLDSVGEADLAVLLGFQFKNIHRGLTYARGWDGDHVALFGNSDGHRLLLWASSWDSTSAAARYSAAWLRERQIVHRARITKNSPGRIEWKSPDGRSGMIRRDGKRVTVFETDAPEALDDAELTREITFVEPPENAARAAGNNALSRYNPLWSWQKDGDYVVARSLGGLLSRHDRNAVGAADRFLLGLVAESRRTVSFHKWEVADGWLARHESEARRGYSKTTLLPWGVLASHSSARLPQSPDQTIACTRVLWGFGPSAVTDVDGRHSFHVLPFGLLFCRTTAPGESSIHILGTGISRHESARRGSTTRLRLLGIPIWTTHAKR